MPADVQELIQRAENPDFQWGSCSDDARQRLGGVLESRCCHLGLFGVSGSGKSATAQAIVGRLMRELEEKGRRPALLRGTCPKPTGEPIAYAPFRQALAQHFEVNLLAAPGARSSRSARPWAGCSAR